MNEKYLQLNDIDAYRISFHLSNFIWETVIQWEQMPQRTVGEQFIRAADSISANIAEGFGPYYKKDKIKFYRYSSGSVKECFDWTEKAKVRKLVTQEQHEYISRELQQLPEAINRLIKFTNIKLVL